MLVALFVVELIAWAILPTRVAKSQVAHIAAGARTPYQGAASPFDASAADTAKLLMVFQTKVLVADALLARIVFLGGVVYMIEGQRFVLSVMGIVGLLMLATFPTRGRLEQWLKAQQSEIDKIRLSGDFPASPTVTK